MQVFFYNAAAFYTCWITSKKMMPVSCLCHPYHVTVHVFVVYAITVLLLTTCCLYSAFLIHWLWYYLATRLQIIIPIHSTFLSCFAKIGPFKQSVHCCHGERHFYYLPLMMYFPVLNALQFISCL